jgi:hypothetical protein
VLYDARRLDLSLSLSLSLSRSLSSNDMAYLYRIFFLLSSRSSSI